MGGLEDGEGREQGPQPPALHKALYLQPRMTANMRSPKNAGKPGSPSSSPGKTTLPPIVSDKANTLRSNLKTLLVKRKDPLNDNATPGSPRPDVEPLGGLGALRKGPALRGMITEDAPGAPVPAAQPAQPRSSAFDAASRVADANISLPYVKLIHTLREYPTTEDFAYLRRLDAKASVYDPYALEVTPYALIDKADFYTMSVRGITHYVDGLSYDFATLDQWERELRQFGALKAFKIFRMYKLWKPFQIWRKAVSQAKFAHARAVLEKNLFVLSPTFRARVAQFHGLCHDLSTMRLHACEAGQTYTLDGFVERHEVHRAACEGQLEEFHNRAYDTVLDACEADLEVLEERLAELGGLKHGDGADPEGHSHSRASSPGGEHSHAPSNAGTLNVFAGTHGARASSVQGALSVAATEAAKAAASEFAYTVGAARRSEQRRILNFVRMTDYVMCDTLQTVLLESVREVLGATLPPAKQEEPESQDDDDDAESADGDYQMRAAEPSDTKDAPSKDASSKVLFNIDLLLGDGASLVYSPSPPEFQEQMAGVLSTFADSLCSLTRLYGDEGIMEVVMGDKIDEVEEGTELQDLVANEDYDNLVSEVQESLSTAFQQTERHKSVYSKLQQMVVLDASLDIPALAGRFQRKAEVAAALAAAAAKKEAARAAKEAAAAAAAAAGGEEGANGPQDDNSDGEGEEDEEEMEQPVALSTFRELLDMLKAQVVDMEALTDHADVRVIRVGLAHLKAALLPSPTGCLARMHELLPSLASDLFQGFMGELQNALSRLQSHSSCVEDYVEKVTFLIDLRANEKSLDMRNIELQDLYTLIDEYAIEVPAMDRAAYGTMEKTYTQLKVIMEEVETAREDNVNRYSSELESGIEGVGKTLKELRAAAQHEMVLNVQSEHAEVVAYLTDLKDQCEVQRSEAARINKYQAIFKLGQTPCEEMNDVADEVALKLQLWTGRADFDSTTSTWAATLFDELDVAGMEEMVARTHKGVVKMERGLVPNKLVPVYRDRVDEYRQLLPVVAALRNRALKERHWHKVFDAIGTTLNRDEGFTLQVLLDAKVQEHQDAVTAISTEATQEMALEELLTKVVSKWADVEFVAIPYKEQKDVYILGGIEEVQIALEDSMVTMSTILASRFVGGIRHDVEKVERQLNLFSETLDEWLAMQKAWMYLEPIFSAPDIQRQLPLEAKAFLTSDKQFKDVMRKTKDRPNALAAGTVPGLLDMFKGANEMLEKIQKNLEDYLETKRMGFPRFYFLSNDELLEILAQTKNVQAVQPHMGKCFDGIRRLDFGDDPKSIDINAMISGEGETVSLGKNCKARGNVEKWLTDVENAMIASLKRLARTGFSSYAEEPRDQWVLGQPAQLVIAVSQIYWCASVEECLRSDTPGAKLQAFLDENIRNLGDLTKLVRGQLSGLQRKIIAALITIDVHARDILMDLLARKTSDVNEFEWQMQLRYSFENDDVYVRQVNARFLYAYEYLGAQSRLVVTPMTDRCYLTLTGALHLKLGGAPAGPAGTGKTETTKDLAKALGVNCVVFNCGDNLDFKFMGKFFSGLAQCGAWACFDEFNRIDIEVLSVVAQQLLTIQNALKANMSPFNFEGRMIKLLPTCGVFITMNPGYAGRTELPDNLKALFRPMAMMIPDYGLVAEVMLFSEGFEDSRTLSRKMVKLYKLSSEQLSQQDHYDFGMRAVKSVLVMAGSLKRGNPTLSEDVVLIRAFRDSNLPKFLIDDVELFQNIISDLFPGVVVPDQDYGDLEKSIKATLSKRGLQVVPAFVTKVIQLYDTMNVRFGVMLVGPTGGGKSECYRTLQGAAASLREARHSDPSYQLTHTYVFNPKCIKMGELYGEYSALTNEWTDGLGSTLIRNAVADTLPDKKWVVFDGPVDAIWIENMNTVLDDNCTLCLPNGERIKLNPTTMRMLFEVEDLSVASPATVSRCGMVYIALEELGWRPYVQTWVAQGLATAVPDAPQQLREYVYQLFDEHVDAGLAWVARNGKQFIPAVENNLTTTLAWMVQSLMLPERGFKYGKGVSPEDQRKAVGKIFAWAFSWALGGNLVHSVKEDFDTFVRDQLSAVVNYPGSGLVFDFCVDSSKSFPPDMRSWQEMVPSFSYDRKLPFFQMLVPTVDTVRFSYLLELNLDVGRSVLFSGVTGVGKSVITVSALEGLRERKGVLPHTINFSAQTTAMDTQLLIEGKLEKKRKTRFGAPHGKRIVFFVDDVNMPARETYGAQPPVELLRQFQDQRGFYDRKKLWWKDIEDTVLVAACAPPGGGRQEMTPRFVRHFTMLCVPPPSEAATKTILSAIFNGFLTDYPPDFKAACTPIVNASVEAYNRISEELLPTPAKSHYTFNLRDLSKVFQGCLGMTPGCCPDKDSLIRLWIHESCRVFHDRLINLEDKVYFKKMLVELMAKHSLGGGGYDALFVDRNIIFGDFMKMGAEREDRKYEEVPDMARLTAMLEEYLDEYNLANTNALNLVFFTDAIEHITRISRVLRQPRGNAMLVGVGGSGKSSLTRFATHMGGFKIFSIELTRGYGSNEFREDLKKLYHTAGITGEPVVFLFSDTQIVNEGFLEDINNMLNSGEVPGMFAQDDKDRVASDIREWVLAQGGSPTKEACYAAFIGRVRDNLHIVLTMSPVGEAFRARCRQFPSLINCCTIDWYSEWPEDALLSVARKFLAGTDLGGDAACESIANMCVTIHTSVAATSDRFYAELRRRYYTTPKSYLDLINLYLQLLREKREEYMVARDRLLNGLDKLSQTNSMVDGMKAELADLQPTLESKSKATAELLVKVAADQKEAELVKKNVAVEEKDVKAMQGEIQVVADDAKADLEEAMPALNSAMDSLKALNKSDIVEIKSFAKPPPLVQMTMEAVCVLKGEPATWDSAKKVLNDSGFMKSLEEFDKDNISDKTIKVCGKCQPVCKHACLLGAVACKEFDKDSISGKAVKLLSKYVDNPVYTAEAVANQSKAAMSLCMWTRAMHVYNRVAKVVGPKREKLREAEASLAAANAKLSEKQAMLKAVIDRVDALKAGLVQAQQEQKDLNDQADITRKRLVAAGKLTSALADEGVRWQSTADKIQVQTDLLVGDVFLSAACIAYYGAFTGTYRQALVSSWIGTCGQRGIP
ncbi:hypothetical protein FOA52_014009, partial [Chlamydomonas sp. UWO 241]